MGDKFKKALKIIAEKLDIEEVKWAVIGSTGLALQGIEITPNDLDIAVRFDDLQKIPEIFPDYKPSGVKELETVTGKPAWDVQMNINEVEIQFVGELDDGDYVSRLLAKRINMVNVDKVDIPCLNLEAAAEAYEEIKRPEKAELIRKFLRKET